LAAAFISLAALLVIVPPHHWQIALALLAVALVYLVRMHRFGQHFAREVPTGFLNLPVGK
jgi:hypothetical protein